MDGEGDVQLLVRRRRMRRKRHQQAAAPHKAVVFIKCLSMIRFLPVSPVLGDRQSLRIAVVRRSQLNRLVEIGRKFEAEARPGGRP